MYVYICVYIFSWRASLFMRKEFIKCSLHQTSALMLTMTLFGKAILGHSHLEWSKSFLVILNRRNSQIDEIGKMSVWLK